MIDDQLAASGEEVGERLRAVRPVEHVTFFDLNPGQVAPLGAQLITQPGELLLPRQMGLAGDKPLFLRHDWVVVHHSFSFQQNCLHQILARYSARFSSALVQPPRCASRAVTDSKTAWCK